jgi:hypothetical protein
MTPLNESLQLNYIVNTSPLFLLFYPVKNIFVPLMFSFVKAVNAIIHTLFCPPHCRFTNLMRNFQIIVGLYKVSLG